MKFRLCHFQVDESVTIAGLDADRLALAAGELRRVRSALDWLETQVAARADQLADAGEGLPSVETLTRSGGRTATDARRVERRAKTLADAPSFAEALAKGRITIDHVDALANAAGRLRVAERDQFLASHRQLVDAATGETVEQFAAHARRVADRLSADRGESRCRRQRRHTSLRRWHDAATGMYRIAGEFDPETGHGLFTAIDAEVAAMVAASGERTADRNHLGALALAKLVSTGHGEARPTKAQVTVVIDYDRLMSDLHDAGVCELDDGQSIPAATARRLACDAEILPVVLGGDSVPLDLGRSRRLASPAQRAALRSIYRTCGFDGCDVPFRRCEIHHLDDWATSRGPTDLHRLVPICSRHHHQLHEGRWFLELAPDRTLTIQYPTGPASGEVVGRSRPDRRPPTDGVLGNPGDDRSGSTLTDAS